MGTGDSANAGTDGAAVVPPIGSATTVGIVEVNPLDGDDDPARAGESVSKDVGGYVGDVVGDCAGVHFGVGSGV